MNTYSRLYARPKPALAWCLAGVLDRGAFQASVSRFLPALRPGAFTAHPVLFGG